MAQYTNPYAQQQQYYTTTATSPYATGVSSTATAQGTAYNQYMNATAQYMTQTPVTPQYSQYQTPVAYQQTPYATQTYAYGAQPAISPRAPMPTSSGDGANAVWMGDIDPWMDENFLYSLFAHTGEVLNVKLIRDKQTGMPSNYCFVHFATALAAQKVIENFNGQPIPGTNKVFRLNWAQYGIGGDKSKVPQARIPSAVPKPTAGPRPGPQDEVISLFIGDLAPDVTDYYILSTFQYYYPSAYHAKVVTDPKTGLSKGFGFVYFTDESEKTRALNEMQGYYLSYRPIRLNLATKKGETKPPQYIPGGPQPNYSSSTPSAYPNSQGSFPQGPNPRPHDGAQPNEAANSTVFVGGIDPSVTHEVLKAFFAPFGEIGQVKIPYGKGCAFIEYITHDSAARVLATFNGSTVIGNSQVRLSWGRPAKSGQQQQPVQPIQGLSASSLTAPPRPQITSQTSTLASQTAQALLGQAIKQAESAGNAEEGNEGQQEEGYTPTTISNQNGYDDQGSYQQGFDQSQYQSVEGYQPQYATQHYQGSSEEYVPGLEEGAVQNLRHVTNEDVNQAPPADNPEELTAQTELKATEESTQNPTESTGQPSVELGVMEESTSQTVIELGVTEDKMSQDGKSEVETQPTEESLVTTETKVTEIEDSSTGGSLEERKRKETEIESENDTSEEEEPSRKKVKTYDSTPDNEPTVS